LGVQYGLEQRHARLGPLQEVDVGDELLHLVALQRVLLDALDGPLREESVDGIDPFGNRQLRRVQGPLLIPAALTSAAPGAPIPALALAPVEVLQSRIAIGVLALHAAADVLGLVAEDQSPANFLLPNGHGACVGSSLQARRTPYCAAMRKSMLSNAIACAA